MKKRQTARKQAADLLKELVSGRDSHPLSVEDCLLVQKKLQKLKAGKIRMHLIRLVLNRTPEATWKAAYSLCCISSFKESSIS